MLSTLFASVSDVKKEIICFIKIAFKIIDSFKVGRSTLSVLNRLGYKFYLTSALTSKSLFAPSK